MRKIIKKEIPMKKRANKPRKTPNVSVRRGFTLVELSVVMAVMVILAGMVVSFSVLMRGHAEDISAQNEFSTDVSAAEKAITTWLSEKDVKDAVFKVENGSFSVLAEKITFNPNAHALVLGDKVVSELFSIEGVVFETNGTLIKWTIRRTVDGAQETRSFVFYPRLADILGEEGAE